MLKYYLINGKEWQYEEGEQPDGAIELHAEKTATAPEVKIKAVTPKNKARKGATK